MTAAHRGETPSGSAREAGWRPPTQVHRTRAQPPRRSRYRRLAPAPVALAAAVVLLATACLPYNLHGSVAADVSWAEPVGDGTVEVFVHGEPEPIWTFDPAGDEGSWTPLAGDWDGDGWWEPAFATLDGIVSPTTTRPFALPEFPPDTPTGTPCIYPARGAQLIPGQWDGEPGTDMGYFLPRTATWQIEGFDDVTFGRPVPDEPDCGPRDAFDVPVPADYDGDGITDIAVYEVDTGDWKVHGDPTPIANLGVGIGIPAPADYDGDGDDDPALLKTHTDVLHLEGMDPVAFSGSGIPVPADYDADGDDDPAVVLGCGDAPCTWEIHGQPQISHPSGYLFTPRDWITVYIIDLTFTERCVEVYGTC